MRMRVRAIDAVFLYLLFIIARTQGTFNLLTVSESLLGIVIICYVFFVYLMGLYRNIGDIISILKQRKKVIDWKKEKN